jgi:predicted TIM-barrel fold metal-dependent hydrolase
MLAQLRTKRIIFCAILVISTKAFSYQKKHHIDFHVHLGIDIQKDLNSYKIEIDKILKLKNLKKAIVITPTYLHSRHDPGNNDMTSFKTVEHILKLNTFISQEIAAHSEKISGLCGISIHREDAVETAELCLKLPGMIGIKLRNFSLNPKENGTYFGNPLTILKRFERLIKLSHDTRTVVLSHFSGNQAELEGLFQVNQLLHIMNKYPKAKLIIAHSGIDSFIGLEGLSHIGNFYKENSQLANTRNIYLDISKTFSMAAIGIKWDTIEKKYQHTATWDQAKDYVTAWKTFGMDYIVFGSDYGCESDSEGTVEVLDELDIVDCPYLSDREKDQIFITNAERLLSTLRIF